MERPHPVGMEQTNISPFQNLKEHNPDDAINSPIRQELKKCRIYEPSLTLNLWNLNWFSKIFWVIDILIVLIITHLMSLILKLFKKIKLIF